MTQEGVQDDSLVMQEDSYGMQEHSCRMQYDSGGIQEDSWGIQKDSLGIQKDSLVIQEDPPRSKKGAGDAGGPLGEAREGMRLLKDADDHPGSARGPLKDSKGAVGRQRMHIGFLMTQGAPAGGRKAL
jgi:hypothetical protein